jgi:hypothetical protein
MLTAGAIATGRWKELKRNATAVGGGRLRLLPSTAAHSPIQQRAITFAGTFVAA